MSGVLISQVHAPEATNISGPHTYDLNAWYPPLYSDKAAPTDPTEPSSGGAVSDGTYVTATCDASVGVGLVVVADPSEQGQVVIEPANSNSPQAVLGIVVAKMSPTRASVQTGGIVARGLSGLVPGVNYYVGAQGALRAPPLNGVVFAQLVGQALEPTTLNLTNNGQVFKRQAQDDGENEDGKESP